MWANRTRRGKKEIENDRGINIIEVNHPEEGMMVFRPSSAVMPARPLGAPLEIPVIPAVVKKEVEEDEAEAVSSHFSVLDAVTESSILKTTESFSNIDTPNEIHENADENVPKVKIKNEPLYDVSDNIESTLLNDNLESPRVIEKIPTELNQKSTDLIKGAEVDTLEKRVIGQKSLALWDLEKMFPDSSSKNIEDQSHFDSQPFKKTYLDFCLNFNKTDVEQSLEYLKTSLLNTKKNQLFCLEVPSQKNITSAADYSTSKETDSAVKCNISTEALKKILAVSNLPSISSDLPGQSKSQLFETNIPHQQTSSSGLKEIVNIKKEPVSPKKEPYKLEAGKGNASIKSKVQSVSQPISSKIVPEVSVTPKESTMNRKNTDNDWTKVAIKKEVLLPENNFNNNGETSKRKKTFDTDVNAAEKRLKKESVPVENFACFEEKNNVAPKQTVHEKKISCNLDIPSLNRQSDSTTSVRHIPEINRFNDVDLNATKMHIEKEVDVSVENFIGIDRLENANAFNTNIDLSPHITKAKWKTTEQDNRMDVSRISSIPTVKDTPSVIRQSVSTTSVRRNKVIDRFLTPQIPLNSSNSMIQNQYSHLQETACSEAPQKKRKLTPQEYLQRKPNSASSNSNITKCPAPQASPINPLDHMSQMDNSVSFPRDPRLQKILTPSILPSSHDTSLNEIGSNFSHNSFKSSVPISRERLSSQEFKEPLRAHQISQCDSRSQNVFEPLRGNNNNVMKHLREKIGRRFIEPGDVTGLILEWNVSWLEQQKETSVVPPIIYNSYSYPEVKNTYDSVESYYNTYLPLHLLNIWMSMYKSWERQEFLPNCNFESREEKTTYVRICCSMTLNAANQKKLPKTEDILICHVGGHSLFGKVVKVHVGNKHSSQLCNFGEVNAYIDFICAQNFEVNSRRPLIKLQKLNNVRIALHICHALKYINSFLRLAILNPKSNGSQIGVIHTQPFFSVKNIKSNIAQIMKSAKSRSEAITLVHTLTPCDSLKAITFIVPEVVKLGGLLFLCMKEEETFFEMAADMKKYDPVLAIKEEDVPRLPRELAQFTIKNRLEELERCHVVLTLMSAISIGELETRLRKDSLEEGKNAMCLVHEAQYFLETETALLLEHNFKSLVLLGRQGLVDDVEARLKRQSFDKSLFVRIFENKTHN